LELAWTPTPRVADEAAAGDQPAIWEWVVAEQVELMEDWEPRQIVRRGGRMMG
jgi:hypothetical protein